MNELPQPVASAGVFFSLRECGAQFTLVYGSSAVSLLILFVSAFFVADVNMLALKRAIRLRPLWLY